MQDDLKLWLPNAENPPPDLDLETSRFLLKQVGDHFCDLLVQEKEAYAEHMSEGWFLFHKLPIQNNNFSPLVFFFLYEKYYRVNQLLSISDKTVAWKRVVQGVREMCDVCETTLFNFHWACSKCGFVVCIDCYKVNINH